MTLIRVSLVMLLLLSVSSASVWGQGSRRLSRAATATQKAEKEAKQTEAAEETSEKPTAQPVALAKEKAASSTESAKKLKWAEIKLSGSLPEGPSLPGLFGEISESMNRIFERLDAAAKDKEIQGIVLKIENPTIGLGGVHELRTKILQARESGKPVYGLLETATTADYLIATACDQIHMPEPGLLMMTGLRAEVSFYKNLLDMLDVEADILRVGKFKSAAEPYTRTEMSPEFRQEIEEMLDEQFQWILSTIAKSRGLTEKQVRRAIDLGPHTPKEALKLGLIDGVHYPDEVETLALADQENTTFELVEKYGRKKVDTNFDGFTGMMKLINLMMGVEPGAKKSDKPQVAIIYANGAIMPGRGTSGPFGDDMIGSETMVETIREVAKNDRVKAIVLRVNSPGGSATASDLIWRALEKVEKPIVVSMGDVAASGGYYISMGADYIYAEPGTITGSIGVVGGKLAFEGLFRKLGITTSVVSRGQNAGALSMTTPFSDTEKQAMQKMMNEIYETFTTKAAAGRKMPLEKLEELAGGRIYLGQQAVKNGLVDEIGTLDEAVTKAAELAELDPASFERLLLPKPTSPFEQLFGPVDTRLHQPTLLEQLRDIIPEDFSTTIGEALRIEWLSGQDPRLLILPFQLRMK